MRLYKSRSASGSDDANVLPLINVVFLLLVFFMIAGVIERSDLFDVTPPTSATEASQEDREGLLLMSVDGRLALGDNAVTRETLGPAVSAWLADHPDGTLTLKADAATPAVEVIDIVEILRSAGAPRVLLLATEGTP